MPFRRLCPARYIDGIDELIGREQAEDPPPGPFSPPTPSARTISLSVVRDSHIDEYSVTHMLMAWGKFLSFDLSHTTSKFTRPEEEQCSSCKIKYPCEPIRIPEDDPVYADNGGTTADGKCLSFVRSEAACNVKGVARQQMNYATSYIDASMVYGSSRTVADAVREFRNGRLKVGDNNLLPYDTSTPTLVRCPSPPCFLAGDVRANMQISVTALHTIFVREHNRIAHELLKLNPAWADEKVYQEARKIVGAMVQKITYKDFLLKIIGPDTYKIVTRILYRGYNPRVDATIPNSFATAAFRFGHSLVRPVLSRYLSDDYESGANKFIGLQNTFFNTTAFLETGPAPILRGLATQTSRRLDEFLNTVLTNQLFKTSDRPGEDLASLNIQRGREHGIPPYSIWVQFSNTVCHNLTSSVFCDIENQLTQSRLKKLYGSINVCKYDLWVGGLAERRLPDSLVGPTFACIIGLTFAGLQSGDRFYYENEGTFTEEQRNEIAKASLARIICDNTDISLLQQDVFRSYQQREKCSTFPSVNLQHWKEGTNA